MVDQVEEMYTLGEIASHLNSEKPDEEIMVECPELLRKSESSVLRGKLRGLHCFYHKSCHTYCRL